MAEKADRDPIARQLLVALGVAAAVALVGWLDTVTGLRPDVTVLYLVPIGLATYAFGLWPGLLVAAIAAIAEILSHPGGEGFSETAIVADAATHLAVFVLAAVVADTLLRQLARIRRLEHRRDFDLAVAREVYETTLEPPVTERSDVEVGFRQTSAFELGGDYAYLSDTRGGVFLCIGDISGKGTAAALFAVALHQTVLEALQDTDDPARVADSVNRRLHLATPGQMFVTLFCALIENGEVRYVNAGHEPPLVLPPSGEPRPLVSEHTLPLGIQSDMEAEAAAVPFPPGSLLLAVTDGVTESPRMQPDPRGRLATLLSARRGAQPREVADAVFAAAAPLPGESQQDDITVLCIRRLA